MSDPAEQAERRYRRGAELWGQRDLEQAVLVLDEARRISEPAPDQPWLGAITRALAQIALERDDPDTADRHLQREPDDPVGRLQHQALRARAALLRGDDGAAAPLGEAVARFVTVARPEDVGTTMNAAIGMAWAADVLVELREPTAAARVARLGTELVEQAGVHDPVVASMLALGQARAAGLVGDLAASEAHLNQVDRTADPDLDLQWTAEHARRAWRRGDPTAAAVQYDAAIAAAERAGLTSTARLLSAERSADQPPTARVRVAPPPTTGTQDAAGSSSYAVVLRLVVDDDPERYGDLESHIDAMLTARPELGSVDGTGGDGSSWDLYLDGEDPDALWAAIEGSVRAAHPPAGSRVARRVGTEMVERPLDP